MKTLKQNSRAALMALSLMILMGAALAASSAEAGVNVKVRINTPAVKATLHSGGHGPGLRVQVQPQRHQFRITKFDRKVARKLARRTAYNKQELLRLKRDGYSWAQVGNILHLPRRSVQNILRQVSLEMDRGWQRLERHDGRCDRDDYRDRYDGRDSRRGNRH